MRGKASSFVSRSRYWDFKIEQKLFDCYLSTDGGNVIISERTRFVSFELRVSIAGVVWMKEALDEVIIGRGAVGQFVSKYRGPNYVLFAERYENQRGVFLKFSQVRNGEVRNIIILGGRLWWGWKKMADCLENMWEEDVG